MKILQIHNRYNIFGGEDTAVEEEALLLRSNTHEVFQIIRNNKIELNNFVYYESVKMCGYSNAPCTHYLKQKLKSKNYYNYKVILNY